MMLKLVLSLILVGFALCDEPCDVLQRLKVKHQWAVVFDAHDGKDRYDLNEEIWREIFRQKPEARDQFFSNVRGDNIYSAPFRAHAARVMGGFDMCLSLLEEEETLNSQLGHLKKQHVDLNVDAVYFDVFSQALMDAVQRKIGHCFDQDAWSQCMDVIEGGIKH